MFNMKNFVKLLTAMAALILIYTAICFYLTGDKMSPAVPPEFCPTNESAEIMVLNQWTKASQYTPFDYKRS